MASNYDVLNLDKINENPYCAHGPTVVFTNEKKTFYACSACRDHKLCNFYLDFEDGKKLSVEKLKIWFDRYQSANSHLKDYEKLRKEISKMNFEERKYCQNCNKFIYKSEKADHSKHQTVNAITDDMLKQPISKILTPVELNSANAQFVFDEKTNKFIQDHVKKFEYDSVLCIGCPSIFENLNNLNKILLDIDDRFMLFYNEDEFQKFNMFNNHFFFNKEKNFENFLSKSKKLFVIIDPPYGGIVRLIANTLESIKKKICGQDISFFLIYPYFTENWIKKWLPEFKMLDYKVSYNNQKNFSQNSNLKKGSPARIFTNLPLDKVELPKNEGYAFCNVCSKYTYEENIHCYKCGICPSKDGFFYKHCSLCERCVKSSYLHCKKCKRCHLETNECSQELIKPTKRRLECKNKNKKFKK